MNKQFFFNSRIIITTQVASVVLFALVLEISSPCRDVFSGVTLLPVCRIERGERDMSGDAHRGCTQRIRNRIGGPDRPTCYTTKYQEQESLPARTESMENSTRQRSDHWSYKPSNNCRRLIYALVLTNIPTAIAQSCISLADSTQCSGFNASSISTDSTLTGLLCVVYLRMHIGSHANSLQSLPCRCD